VRKLILLTAVGVAQSTPLALANSAAGKAAASTTPTEIRLAASDPMGRCAVLDARFQRTSAMHKAGGGSREAAALHTEGETLCSSHQPAAGAKYLAAALKVIHAQPRT
jgi:hypothetical protein